MSIPKPGDKVRGSKSGEPVMALFDLMGRRWAMGIVWNMDNEPITFRLLQSRCEFISPSILNSRIKDLREAGIIERTLDGYILTKRGQDLKELLKPLGSWSKEWAEEVFEYF